MYKTAARFMQRQRTHRPSGQKGYQLTKEDWRQIRTVKPSGIQMQRPTLPVAQQEFFQTKINLVHTRQREQDAFAAGGILAGYGAQVKLIEVEDYGNSSHVGKLYYFQSAGGDADTAARIAQVVKQVATVVPSIDKLRKWPSKTPYALWLVRRR